MQKRFSQPPLEGVRILDLSVVWAAPFGTMQLAALGAEVIRVESMHHLASGRRGSQVVATPEYIERARAFYSYSFGRNPKPKPYNGYYVFNYYDRNKISMTVDLRRPEGREIFLRLVEISDGVVENQAARNMENQNIDYDVLSEVNPQIIMIRMPAFGISGPYWHRLGYGYTMDAIGGHTSLRHYPGPDPITSSVFHGDAAGGGILASMFLMALHYRDRTGEGQLIDISQTENAQCTYAPAFMDYFMNNRVQGTLGNRDATMAPQCVYQCKDNEPPLPDDNAWFVLSVENDEQWQALCRVLGRPELADDPRFADVISRKKNEELLDPIITEWAVDKDQYEVMRLLQAEGIPGGPVIHQREVFTDPHLEDRGYLVEIDHPYAGTHRYPGNLYKLPETPCRWGPAPLFGQHNDYVYRELLGYSDEEIQRLTEEQHIGDEMLPTAR